MIDRRQFLIAGASISIAACGGNGHPGAELWSDRAGIQLHSLREQMRENVGATLKAVAQIGYKEVEFAGYFDVAPKEVRQILDAEGLKAPAAHVRWNAVDDPEAFDRALDDCAVIGHRYVVLPWMPTEAYATADSVRRTADKCNAWGAKAKAAGLRFAYHNHRFEFEAVDGEIPYDILLERTDPDLVAMELDLCWISYMGIDPATYIDRFPGRFELFHLKTYNADRELVPLPQGVLDFDRFFALGERAGLRHAFYEKDDPADALAGAKESYAFLADAEVYLPRGGAR